MLTAPIYELSPQETRVIEFKGLNRKSVIADGELRDMWNLSSDEYPCLSQRKPRGTYRKMGGLTNPTDMISKDGKLAVIADGAFYFDGVMYPALSLSDHTVMVAINTRICFFPEKLYFNVKTMETGSLSAVASGENITVKVTTSTLTITEGQLKIKGFQVGDAVNVTAEGEDELNVSAVIESVTETSITFPDETFISVIADGKTEKSFTTTKLTIERSCPDLDFVAESNNRLWGVSNADNTIYACKLGDPTNWTYYQNTSLDSYYAEQGTDGEWTGCAAYSTHLLFFKEDYIHKVYGSKPASFRTETARCHALEKGSSRSIAIINETVLYKSRLGMMAYAGGVPFLISDNFGTDKYMDVVAGTDGVKYYASMMREGGGSELLVFDMERMVWHKEDDVRAKAFCYHDGKLMFIDDTDRIRIIDANAEDADDGEEEMRWIAELGPYHEFVENTKIYSKIGMRLKLEEKSELGIFVKMNDGEWEALQYIDSESDRALTVPVVPRRCDNFSIKLEGKGRCRIESVVRQYRHGTEGRMGI